MQGLKHVRVDMVQRAWRWLAHELVQDAPEDIALCEFDCRKPQCTYSDWLNCERRLKKAEGELMPARRRLVSDLIDNAHTSATYRK
jgi:hypothetical protein